MSHNFDPNCIAFRGRILQGNPDPDRKTVDADLDVSLQISAQESRRKKKEFVDTLERQVEVASQELDEYKKRCQGLEKENRYACHAPR